MQPVNAEKAAIERINNTSFFMIVPFCSRDAPSGVRGGWGLSSLPGNPGQYGRAVDISQDGIHGIIDPLFLTVPEVAIRRVPRFRRFFNLCYLN
jgi:hypothetical protein